MKIISKKFLTLFVIFSALVVSFAFVFSDNNPLPEADLMSIDQLYDILSNPNAKKPVIYNVGPMQNIKGSLYIGSTAASDELEKLKRESAKLTKDKQIVLYCGCCEASHCPNVAPALDYLKSAGFTKAKVLNIPKGLNEDWVDKGYPMEVIK
jgi:thiosulfate/3-mercaptopyruvate sulfurtransferase